MPDAEITARVQALMALMASIEQRAAGHLVKAKATLRQSFRVIGVVALVASLIGGMP